MYSDLYKFPQPNYYFPHYFNVPAYSFGDFLVGPINIGELPIIPINPIYPYKNEAFPCSPATEIEIEAQSLEKMPLSEKQQKKKKRTQVSNNKNKSCKKRKNKKNVQKDDRNVVSNLLKIFFKNLLDLHKWDQYLRSLIHIHGFQTSLKRFFQWINNFQVNYRNYIKAKEIKDLLLVQHCRDHQILFRLVLRRFVYLQGIPHCLTARRIDRASVRRHVLGIRQLQSLYSGNKN